MITYIIPTRDRPERLLQTLEALALLGDHANFGGAQVIVVDNASRRTPTVPRALNPGVSVRLIALGQNMGAASRTIAAMASDPICEWLVMLDDDSAPRDGAFIPLLYKQPSDVAAVSADVFLPRLGSREAGGLPEVFIGCGVAIRRHIYLELGGYDPTFNYYAEEYDLSARILLAGLRTVFEPAFRVDHYKDTLNRDMDLIVSRLVRNNGWVMQRYAPEDRRRAELREIRRRYRRVGQNENATSGFTRGLLELRRTIRAQRRTPMPAPLFDRFTGLYHAREAIGEAHRQRPFKSAALIEEGKNAWAVKEALSELGVRLTPADTADALVIGTMSPGPMLDAYKRLVAISSTRLIAPWSVCGRTIAPLRLSA